MDRRIDPMATDGFAFLMREFEFPYLASRLFFMTGIMTTLLGVSLRAWFVFHQRKHLSRACICIVIAGTTQMINFFNWTLLEDDTSFWGLWGRLFSVFWADWTSGFGPSSTRGIYPWVCMGSFALAIWHSAKSLTREIIWNDGSIEKLAICKINRMKWRQVALLT